MALVPKPGHGSSQLLTKVCQIPTTDIAQFDPFEIVPDALIGVEIRGIAGQLLQVEAAAAA